MSRSVLVVEPGRFQQNVLGAWLEQEGFDVLACPGPTAPDYTCIGSTGASCPLAEAADVVVLDMHLNSDAALQGTPGWELLFYYMTRGERLVVLSGDEDAVRPRTEDGVIVLRRPVDRTTLIDAVRTLAAASSGGGPRGDDPAD